MTAWSAWLLGSSKRMSSAVAGDLYQGLYTSLPIFLGGVINSTAIAAVAAWRIPTTVFYTWLAIEVVLACIRLPLVIAGRRALREGRSPRFLGLTAMMSCAWAASVGFGAYSSILSGDWVLATIVSLSASAMVCGICLRNFGTPRLCAVMVVLSLLPCAVAGVISDNPLAALIGVQLPIFMVVITGSAFALHRMTLDRMVALDELARSEGFNKSILEAGVDYTVVINSDREVVFCNQPEDPKIPRVNIGDQWLSLLPENHHEEAQAALAEAENGGRAHITICRENPNGESVWFDVVLQSIPDQSNRVLMVARDISHQKRSEENALWLAQHDPLTNLPNRALLTEILDAVLDGRCTKDFGALLIVDVDNFKTINDSVGHDGGDALLRDFSDRLRTTVGRPSFVARTGGDEFAILVQAENEADLQPIAAAIFAQMAKPFRYGRMELETGASIGAAFIRKCSKSRKELFKCADIALYAAKAAGRARLKVFQPHMRVEVEQRQHMMTTARRALQRSLIEPYYQPKVLLGTNTICGYEALMRWTDHAGVVHGPMTLEAALDDPNVGPRLTIQMLDSILRDMSHWLRCGLPFGHVALNLTSADFRSASFVTSLLARLHDRAIPAHCLQVEVTESVFLGRAADTVESGLRAMKQAGISIALDDFGTGYASLSHLRRFPVDVIKIDRTFVQDIGTGADAEGISAAVISLGHSMGMEVVAEGVETREQEEALVQLGCDLAQGYLYSPAVSAVKVQELFAKGTIDRCSNQRLRA